MSDSRSDILAGVKEFYNDVGEYFSKTRQKVYGKGTSVWPEMKPTLARLKDEDRVLDVGCGNGRLLTGVKAKVKYLGVDFSEALVMEAKKLHKGRRFLVGDVTKPKGWEGMGEYEAIFSVAVLHHLPIREQQLYVLRQIKKHLKPGGFVYVSVWNLWQRRFLPAHAASWRMKLKNWRWVMVPFDKKWERFCFLFDRRYVVGLMKGAGLTVEEMYYADKTGKSTSVWRGRNLVVIVK